MTTNHPATPEQMTSQPTPDASKQKKPFRNPEFWTPDKLEDALRKSHGIFSRAAQLLQDTYGRTCSPRTISAKVAAHPYLQQICKDSRSNVVDLCEYRMFYRADYLDDHQAQAFLLKTLGKDRGYSNKVEIGGTVGVKLGVNDLGLTLRDQSAA